MPRFDIKQYGVACASPKVLDEFGVDADQSFDVERAPTVAQVLERVSYKSLSKDARVLYIRMRVTAERLGDMRVFFEFEDNG
jgi:hypothetical protein